MNEEEFAEAFFEEAKKQGKEITSQKNIKCKNGKSLSKDKLKEIYKNIGDKCKEAKTEDFKNAGIESCCFNLFKEIVKNIFK